jgi:hypothetical protein
MKQLLFFGLVIFILTMLVAVEPAVAGPGGKIARAAFETFWGRVILGILVVIFLPLITYVVIREKRAERRARKDLRFMALHSSMFELLKIQERAKDCFFRVHSGWEKEDLSGVSDWMTDWYWQNQQLVHLDRWKHEGLINICDVKKINYIRPLLFSHRNDGAEHEGSMVVLAIEALMKDYLRDRKTEQVVEGSKRYKDVETIWTFTLENSAWKVSDIEASSMSLSYANMVKDLPRIETTLLGKIET